MNSEWVNEWYLAARLSQISEGVALAVEIAGRRLVVLGAEGEVFVATGACPRDGAPLGGAEVRGRGVVCPRHGGRLDLAPEAGEAPAGNADERLSTYPVMVVDDEIFVHLADAAGAEPSR